jgi:hypothetical protein
MVVGRELKNSRIQEFRSQESGVQEFRSQEPGARSQEPGARSQEPAATKQRKRGIDRHGKTLNSYRPSLPELLTSDS